MHLMRHCHLAALLSLAACTARTPAAPTTSGVTATRGGQTGAEVLLFQPVLSREGEAPVPQGTGFFVRGAKGELFAITSAHYLGYQGPPVSRVDLLDVTDGKLLGVATHSWGRPGAGGIEEPLLDLGDDILALVLPEPPPGIKPVALTDVSDVAVGARVWLPNKAPGSPSGYTRIEGVVVNATLTCLKVRLDERIPLQSQSGSPVLFADNDRLVGVVSRGQETDDGKTELWLTPAHYVELALVRGPAAFPLEAVAGAGGVGEVTALRYGWPVGEALLMQRQQWKGSDLRSAASKLSSYVLDLMPHKEGMKVRLHDFAFDHPPNTPQVTLDQANRLAGVVPPMIIDPAGAFVRLDEPEAMVREVLLAMGPMPDAQRKAMEQMLKPELLAAAASSEWNLQVAAWAGDLELGAVYVTEYTAAPFTFTGDMVPTRLFFSATHRTACTPEDRERACVALWMSVQPDQDAMMASARNAVLKATPPDKQAEAAAAIAQLRMEATMRITLVSDPKTLLPVYWERERYVTTPGKPPHYELRQERLVNRKPLEAGH